MASDKATTAHAENAPTSPHESALLGVIALASLFSNCVEAFNLIRASQKWEHSEQLLLARIGIQQARLLIWGDVLGIASPPTTVTTSAVPKHPSAAYPDLTEPTFFGPRDGRLEEQSIRLEIEEALNAIVDRSSHLTREQMMEQFGLRPPKRSGSDYQPALDPTRLDAFREKYELLQEVAESYAHINTRRSNSIALQAWIISDQSRFARFVALTREKIDSLVAKLGVGEQVDKAMRMDIRAFGWHLTADKTRIALDVSKLRLIAEACESDYPQYLVATRQALENISREGREALLPDWKPAPNPKASGAGLVVKAPLQSPGGVMKPPKSSHSHSHAGENGSAAAAAGEKANPQVQAHALLANGQQQKRPSLFGKLFSFKSGRVKSSSLVPTTTSSQAAGRRKSEDSAGQQPPRAVSDAGLGGVGGQDGEGEAMGRVRSKSVGAVIDVPVASARGLDPVGEDGGVRDVGDDGLGVVERTDTNVSRHDQFLGFGRVETRREG